MSLTVLLADDHQLVRTGFRVILEMEDDITVVGEAADGAGAVEMALRLRPDVVLMDVEMPGVDGLEATRRIAAEGGPSVLILTTFDRDDYLFAALRAGASGFLLKNGTPEALTEAVRVVAAGEALLAPAVTRRVISTFTTPNATGVRLDQLTPREHEVLVLLAGGATNAEIATTLRLGETTVKTHVSRVLMKIGARDRTQAVVLAYELGVVRPGG
ncbi:DNA-binding response regulator [Actinoplanes philippinensis]|uniref:DNA-binding response regulator, NarL/FixJ family, contains REC and HTH domains n=1 Tax=Actinoplanes philippinensis TaxID=35752 RepID=A0A1I2JSN7_9ACTN|nr:response regulator transcription factor [Actinoplanes philippinensis]GIE80255.1 DNA-binding response regulator [Actinoplanes philippinensis]SFF57013.1 DNA-binding response regulator, NarL/FixJ family, contains REC and HTH domains [Actinoplanes philippinensis]